MAAALDRYRRPTSSRLIAAHRQYGLIGNGNAGQTSKSPLLAKHRKIKNTDQDQSPSRSTVRGLEVAAIENTAPATSTTNDESPCGARLMRQIDQPIET
jgi:hypothetical protein